MENVQVKHNFDNIKLSQNICYSSVLRTNKDYRDATKELKRLKLPLHGDLPKNWDSYASLNIILKNYAHKKKGTSILDAGGEYYSSILPLLEKLGYLQLECINLSFSVKKKIGNIVYDNGDITATKFKKNKFDVITCLSVIEHGVNIQQFFKEMFRILKPGGLLIVSTDYWHESIDTMNKVAFGWPIKIFNKDEVVDIVNQSIKCGFDLLGTLDLECDRKVISSMELNYTFLYFTLKKM